MTILDELWPPGSFVEPLITQRARESMGSSDPFHEISQETRDILSKLPKGTILREDPDGSLWVRVRKGTVYQDLHQLGSGREFEA